MRIGLGSLQGRIVLLTLLVATVVTAACVGGLLWVGQRTLERDRGYRAMAMGESIDGQLRTFAELGGLALDRLTATSAGETPRLFTHVVAGRSGRVEQRLLAGGVDERRLLGFLLNNRQRTRLVSLSGGPAMVITRPHPDDPAVTLVGVMPIGGLPGAQLQTAGWSLVVDSRPASTAEDGAQAALPRPLMMVGDRGLQLALTYPTVDGELHFALTAPDRPESERELLEAVVVTGMFAALITVIFGMLLGLHWLGPVHRLARRLEGLEGDPSTVSLDEQGPEEARILARAFNGLLARLEHGRVELRNSLRDQEHATQLHRRFVRRIMSELYQPLQVLIGGFDRLAAAAGLEQDAGLERNRQAARSLAERLALLRGMDVDPTDDSGVATYFVRLDTFCGQLCDMLATLAEHNACTLSFQADERRVAFDSNLATQVLVSLIANALQAPGADAVCLRASLERDRLVCRVVDNGNGIPEALAGRIEQACARGSVLPDEQGFGLGLPLALAQIQALGGSLSLEANGPDGVVMAVAIPYREAAVTA